MGKGARPQREFIDGIPRKNIATTNYKRAPKKPEPLPHMDMRIIRQVDTSKFENTHAWHPYLDVLSQKNHGIGYGRSLGALAITYVRATEMNKMLADAYPNDFFDGNKKVKLFRNLGKSITEFIRVQGNIESVYKVEKIAALREYQQTAYLRSGSDEIDDGTLLQADRYEDEELVHQSQYYKYGPAELSVRGLEIYGKSKWGIDLSLNDSLFEEREGLRHHLRGVEGLKTAPMDRDWQPHATLFQAFDHIPVTELRHKIDVPSQIIFQSLHLEYNEPVIIEPNR
ncbi:MAG: hypothetical protein NVSMB46_08120 [Candidatus Saccharimonadales bacterium]